MDVVENFHLCFLQAVNLCLLSRDIAPVDPMHQSEIESEVEQRVSRLEHARDVLLENPFASVLETQLTKGDVAYIISRFTFPINEGTETHQTLERLKAMEQEFDDVV